MRNLYHTRNFVHVLGDFTVSIYLVCGSSRYICRGSKCNTVNCEIVALVSTVECDFDRAEKGTRELVFMRRRTTCFGNEQAPPVSLVARLFTAYAPFPS